MLYRYYDPGVLGPLPDMYEPAWYHEKTLAAIAEGATVPSAVIGYAVAALRARRARNAGSQRSAGT